MQLFGMGLLRGYTFHGHVFLMPGYSETTNATEINKGL